RLVAQVLFPGLNSVRKHSVEAQDALRLRLPHDQAGPMARRFRKNRNPRRRASADLEGERRSSAGAGHGYQTNGMIAFTRCLYSRYPFPNASVMNFSSN